MHLVDTSGRTKLKSVLKRIPELNQSLGDRLFLMSMFSDILQGLTGILGLKCLSEMQAMSIGKPLVAFQEVNT